MRILVFYRELAGYFLDCLSYFCESTNSSALVVALPVNEEAPFDFIHSPRIEIIGRNTINGNKLLDLAQSSEFQLVLSGGWSDRDYIKALKCRSSPSILAFDNHWSASPRQIAGAVFSRLHLRSAFDRVFVPGYAQARFAKIMGFKPGHIYRGFYACDTSAFEKVMPNYNRHNKDSRKRIIYTGRYIPQKFSAALFDAFMSLPDEILSEWELHAYGTGIEWDQRPVHRAIIHHGFVQPEQLKQEMTMGHAFVLPSIFEPWGVVVHEFAAAGFPMLLSNAVGAAEAFLEVGENGFLFESGDAQRLYQGLVELLSCSNERLQRMGEHSRKLAQKITPVTWSQTLLQIAQEGIH